MSPASAIHNLWNARSVAVIGASERPGSLGRKPVDYLLRYQFPGRILPINPKAATILGLPAYASVREVTGTIELALIMVSADRVAAAVEDCIAANIPLAVIASSGFAEVGEAGAAAQAELVQRARRGGLRLIGPNCIGSVSYAERVLATFSPLYGAETVPFEPGTLGFVSQSGALGFGAASLALQRGIRPGWVVSTGNDADVTALEVLAELADKPECTGVLGYLETVPDVSLLRRLSASGTPVALLKSGRTPAGAQAAASHTGALASDDRVLDAALRQFGIVRVDDIDELLDVAAAFESPRRPAGNRVAIVTTSGGSGILAADAVAQHGLELSELNADTLGALGAIVPAFGSVDNPVDITATVLSDPTLFDRSLDVIAADDTVDIILGCFCVMADADVEKAVHSLSRVARESGKPVLVARTGADFLAPSAPRLLREGGLPEYSSPARALRAAAALWQTSRPRPGRGVPADRATTAVPQPAPHASEPEVKELLRGAGLPVPAGRIAVDRADAVAALAQVGGLAVLKAVVPGLLHKTEAGGVRLGVSADSVEQVWSDLAGLGGDVLVEAQAPEGVDLILGVRSTSLGTAITIGFGGILAEVLDDVAHRLLPLAAGDAQAMVGQLRGAAVLHGVRGRAGSDVPALITLIEQVADAVSGWGEPFDLDLNPVRLFPVGATILDAAYIGGRPADPPQTAPVPHLSAQARSTS